VVIATADSKRDHVPYRQSKLTYLLKDSIGLWFILYLECSLMLLTGGNVNALLIANIWSEAEQIEETV
jgi:kinesin family protein 6/9